MEDVQEVVLSPSGRNVAYTVRRATTPPNGTPEYRTQLYVVSSTGRGAPHLLTRNGHSATQPAWHPNGGQIAFVRPVDGTPQVFILSLSGGEPYQLTDFPHGATQPQWGPSGDRLLFTSTLPPSVLTSRLDQPPAAPRPGRTARDTIRRIPPDTMLVLRHDRTLDAIDTLNLGAKNRLRAPSDTGRILESPPHATVPDSLRPLRIDSLRTLSPDSLQTVFRQLRLLPDTTQVPVSPDTTARPDGDLLQRRRWLHQQSSDEAQVTARPLSPQTSAQPHQPSYRHYLITDVPDAIGTSTPPRSRPHLVTKGFRSFRDGTWLPGGRQIIVSAPPERTDSTSSAEHRLYLVDVTSSRTQQLLQIDGYALARPSITADGTTLAFRATPLSDPSYEHDEVGLFDLDGRSNPKLITADFDHDVHSFQWSPNGWYLYITAPDKGGRPIYRFAPFVQDDTSATTNSRSRTRTSLEDEYKTSRDTFALDSTMVHTAMHDQMTSSSHFVQALDVTDSRTIYAARTPENPSEVYTNTVSFNNEKRLTSHNTEWTRRRYFPRSQWITTWNDGLSVPARLTLPSQHQDSLQAPLAVLLRGGPPALAGSSFLSSWAERQHLAERGFGVLEVWPRGSEGFGEAFRRHNFQDWGPGPASDVLAITDSVLARHWDDSPPQVLAGHGYGGTLAIWLASHTDRFDAIAAQSGVYHLDAFSDVDGAGTLIADQFGGRPWSATPPPHSPVVRSRPLLATGLLPPPQDTAVAPRRALRRNAPIGHASQIETPLLLLHGTDDSVVSPSQTERLYRRLVSEGRPVEYVRYPNLGHQMHTATPTQRMDRLVRLHEFFARYVSRP